MELSHIRGEPWFDDGNIILLAEGVAFKVHRGVMARSSEMMQTMFSLPQPISIISDEPKIAGCSVIEMHDDPSMLGDLIRALYDGPELSDGSPQDILGLFGILILCSKYMIIRLRKPILRHLSTMWPSTLAIHDIMVEQALSLDPVQGLSYPFIHPLHVYKLARSINAPSLAPSALYFLSMYPLDADLMEGTHQKLQIKHPALPTTSLILDDILDYTLMYQHRISTLLDFVRTFLPSQTTIFPNCGRSERNVSPGRTPTLQCHKVFKQLESRFSRSWNPRTSPIFMMKQASQAIDADQSVCVSCKRVFRTNIEQLREKTWQDLPGVVGLPDWTQLIATTEEG